MPIDVKYNSLFFPERFSQSCQKANTMCVVALLTLKPHWVSVRLSSVQEITNQPRNSCANNLPAMECKVIHQYYELSDISHLFSVQGGNDCVTDIL